MKKLILILFAVIFCVAVSAKEYHVSKAGNDKNKGTSESPLLTIQAAADITLSGDVITIHNGVYRERITPPRGGDSENSRIVYQAAVGERVEIKGSEVIDAWMQFSGNIWKATIPNDLFGDYNPYKDLIHGDWFVDNGRIHHTGEVYLNGKSMWEMELLEKCSIQSPWQTAGIPRDPSIPGTVKATLRTLISMPISMGQIPIKSWWRSMCVPPVSIPLPQGSITLQCGDFI
jgi:hypothetical protein